MKICGIDPGLRGAACILDGRKRPNIIPMPLIQVGRRSTHDWTALSALIKAINADLYVIEEVTRPAKLVRHQGYLMGCVDSIPAERMSVRPQAWKAHFNLIGTNKDASILKAIELLRLGDVITKKSQDGWADAALLALYARETIK